MRGVFSVMPPPVMCAAPLQQPSASSSAIESASNSCGAPSAVRRRPSRAVPRRRCPARSGRPRTAACAPANSRWCAGPSRAARAARRRPRSSRRSAGRRFSTAPTMKPARSYSPSAYMPGISAVSPPISAQPLLRQPRAIPSTTSAATSGVQLADRKVVEEEQRPGALHGDVVDAVVHQVLADRGVPSRHERDFELGAHAVRRTDQHRLLVARQLVTRRRSCRCRSARCASWCSAPGVLIRSTARSASSMLTPASL